MPNAAGIVKRFFPKVEDVQDAEHDSVIEVTTKDASSRAVKNHRECAMAVACKRKFKADGAIISVGTAYIIKGTKAIRYRLPERVSREVISFDRNGGFHPGEYRLKSPLPSQKLGATKDKFTGKKNPRKAGQFHFFTEGIRTTLGAAKAVS